MTDSKHQPFAAQLPNINHPARANATKTLKKTSHRAPTTHKSKAWRNHTLPPAPELPCAHTYRRKRLIIGRRSDMNLVLYIPRGISESFSTSTILWARSFRIPMGNDPKVFERKSRCTVKKEQVDGFPNVVEAVGRRDDVKKYNDTSSYLLFIHQRSEIEKFKTLE